MRKEKTHTCYIYDTMNHMNFARLVKELREKMLLSQTELAKKLGVSYATINRWENGHHDPVFKDQRRIVKLCKKYGVDLEEKGEDK